MGFGDALIGSGIARGAAKRGKRIAFGDGRHIIWTHHDFEVFQGNPNVAPPGCEGKARDLDWVPYYRGHRGYGSVSAGRWIFNRFNCRPGEVFFTPDELAFANRVHGAAVILEPRVKRTGACSGVNKQWPVAKYQETADILMMRGILCAQVVPPHGSPLLRGIGVIETPTFRHALAALSTVRLYIGPEGGLHHGAAALDIDAVVIFGGFNSPDSTGYPQHTNIAVGKPCGMIAACDHCRRIMEYQISVEEVLTAAMNNLLVTS